MVTRIGLTTQSKFNTSFAPLAVMGYCLMANHFFAPLHAEVQLPMRTVDYTPTAKLEDCLISMLAGCTAIQQINVRLRPDRILARAWRREQFAEQSTIADTLDACTAETIQQLQQVHLRLLRQHSHALHHDFAQAPLWIDVDLTPLPASRRAQASTKGYSSGKKTRAGASSCG